MVNSVIKKYVVYTVFSIAAIFISLLILLSAYLLINNDDQPLNNAILKNKINTLNESYQKELLNQQILNEDLANSTEFYNKIQEEFNSLTFDSGQDNNMIKDLQNELLMKENENEKLKDQLITLEAKLK